MRGACIDTGSVTKYVLRNLFDELLHHFPIMRSGVALPLQPGGFNDKENTMKQLLNKVAVVTGGNSGIGFAAARLFVEEGAAVAITGKRPDAIRAAASDLKAKGIVADSGKLSDIGHMMSELKEAYGKIDVLYLNAGTSKPEQLGEIDEKTFDEVFAVNTKGPFFTIQAALPLLAEGASIILTASIAHSVGVRSSPIYSASKAALRSFGRTLAGALAPRRIRVNTISPGSVKTPMFEKFGMSAEQIEVMMEAFSKQVPLNRCGTPDDIARVALFLASDASSYITGVDIAVDGGFTQILL